MTALPSVLSRLADLADFVRHLSPRVELPYSLRGVRDSWISSTGGEIFWFCLIGLFAGVVLLALLYWRRNLKYRPTPIIRDPDKLFSSLLEHLKLADDDKNLLRQMTAGARLRHPTVCLLSPGMLDWSRRLWQAEKGPETVTPEKVARIDAISVALYDHLTPSSAEAASRPKQHHPTTTAAAR